jgi:hypothetical protein
VELSQSVLHVPLHSVLQVNFETSGEEFVQSSCLVSVCCHESHVLGILIPWSGLSLNQTLVESLLLGHSIQISAGAHSAGEL